ncbi:MULTISPECIES: Ldh family oxidoreductase [unclassified Rhizobium]|uniref:Ldh family oxidoreductase n=1 Tax=unclassified Rhizobium TaxID=2613769 RepID=UPI0007EA79DB|nr:MULTISPECIES: Ldh family oxidoreductase [unclassified Rhizobium]ANK88989.1 malate/L-lactate dehydrogenase family protein [Rhizobium sp. N731]ANL19242.1 malate/L-lactate dehydrogenase family protein [Rhizobium sp. N1314]
MSDEVLLDQSEAETLAIRACRAAGAAQSTARSLVDATLSAALFGPATLGFPHMLDYLDSFREGRINCHPTPTCERPFPAFFVADADRGIAQLGFDLALNDLAEAARTFGVAIFTQTNSYTAGELGYYVRRLAGEGLAGIAATNANAMVVAIAGGPAVYSTNPMAFGFPLGEGSLPLIIDQASSATAYVNIVAAAAEGRSIPEGWAVDETGMDTRDAARALAGALLPFGGRKGANVALMVEMLSAGLSGGPWSLDTPSFRSGNASPAVGLTVIAMMPGRPDDGLVERAHRQAARLQQHGVFIPGVDGIEYRKSRSQSLKMPRAVFETIKQIADA